MPALVFDRMCCCGLLFCCLRLGLGGLGVSEFQSLKVFNMVWLRPSAVKIAGLPGYSAGVGSTFTEPQNRLGVSEKIRGTSF